MAARQPGRTLAEEQAYQQGRVDGRRDTLLALGGAFGKVLEPDSLSSLAKALLDGLRANPPLLEPSSVYMVEGCIFRYCPHPERCREVMPTGCTTIRDAAGAELKR